MFVTLLKTFFFFSEMYKQELEKKKEGVRSSDNVISVKGECLSPIHLRIFRRDV